MPAVQDKPFDLAATKDLPSYSLETVLLMERKLLATVRVHMPELISAVQEALQKQSDIILHQDSFAAGYHVDELTLLGIAIKYAGLFGVKVWVVGTNGDTFKEKKPS